MRILVNGYYYGGNCPPFVHTLKGINPEIKLTNALGILDEHGINRDYLTRDDIIDVDLNFFEKIIVISCKKARIPFWKTILVRKAKKIVEEYKPDIIINHKASEKAEIMLKTGFRPQLTYIYGSEVHGDRIQRRELDYIFNESSYILTTTEHMRSYLVGKRESLKEKVKVYPMGYFEMDYVRNYKKINNAQEVRRKYGFGANETIIFDSRSLRGTYTGFYSIINALKKLSNQGLPFKILFLKGFLGNDYMGKQLRSIMKADPLLAEHIVFIDEVVPNDRIIDYYYISDVFVSILPADQLGKCISEALFLDCSLVLSDLDVYKSHLGSGPCYIKDQDPNQLTAAFESIISGGSFKVESDIYNNLIDISQTRVRFEKLYSFINEVVNIETK